MLASQYENFLYLRVQRALDSPASTANPNDDRYALFQGEETPQSQQDDNDGPIASQLVTIQSLLEEEARMSGTPNMNPDNQQMPSANGDVIGAYLSMDDIRLSELLFDTSLRVMAVDAKKGTNQLGDSRIQMKCEAIRMTDHKSSSFTSADGAAAKPNLYATEPLATFLEDIKEKVQ